MIEGSLERKQGQGGEGPSQNEVAPSLNLSSEELLDHLPDLPGERYWAGAGNSLHIPGRGIAHLRTTGLMAGFQVLGPVRGKGFWVREGPSGVSALTSARWRLPGRPGAGDRPEKRGRR